MFMYVDISISQGQQEARTRWGTHEEGAAFDRKKHTFLTEEAREFIARQVMCTIVGPALDQGPCGLLIAGQPGFVGMPDERTCLIPIARRYEKARFVQGLYSARTGGSPPLLALCFLQHFTRQRICVQGEGEILPSALSAEMLWLRLRVGQAFFHCPKYIRTRIAGLHLAQEQTPLLPDMQVQDRLTVGIQALLERQVLCYLCTRDKHGQCAVNHRGGAPGFLVTLMPDRLTPGGIILLPDYAGNGAFEAIGNILETGKAALLVPAFAEQFVLCISGEAAVLEPAQLPPCLREKCPGAQRIVAITVQRVERQEADWADALAYERARAQGKQVAQCCPC